MKATAIYEWPWPEETDKPDGAAQIQALAEAIEGRLTLIEGLLGTPKVPAEPKPGQLVVVNGTNDPVYKAMTGDATINSAGLLTVANNAITAAKINALAVEAAKIAENAVTTAKVAGLAITTAKLAELAVTAGKIAAEAIETGKIKAQAVTTAKIALLAVTEALLGDGAVTSRKLKPTIGEVPATGSIVGIGGGYTDVPGASLVITPSVASKLVIHGRMEILFADTGGGGAISCEVTGAVKLDEAAEVGTANVGVEKIVASPGGNMRLGVEVKTILLLSAATHTIKLRVKQNIAGTPSNLIQNGTGFLYTLYSQ